MWVYCERQCGVVFIGFKSVRALGEGRKTADRTDHQPAGDGGRKTAEGVGPPLPKGTFHARITLPKT